MAPIGSKPSQQTAQGRDDSRDARAAWLSRVPASDERNVLEPTGLGVTALEARYAGTPASESGDLVSVGVAAGATRLFAVALASGKPYVKIPVSATVPGAAEDGALCVNSADERAYRYFETYSAWLSDQEFWVDFGRAASVSDGEQLRQDFATVQPANVRGYIPFMDSTGDVKVTGMEGRTAGSWTGSFEVYSGATASGVTLAFSSSEEEADFGLDHNFDNTDALGCVINITSGSPTNPTVRVWYRKRWT